MDEGHVIQDSPDDKREKPQESKFTRRFPERYEAGARFWEYLVANQHLFPTTRTPDEQAIIDWMERDAGRKLTPVEIEFGLEQARSIGEI